MKKDSFEKKLAAYVAMASAVLIAHKESNAQIIYTNVNPDYILNDNSYFNLDLNNDGITDYQLHTEMDGFSTGGMSGYQETTFFAYADAQSNNQIIGNPIAKLNVGDTISQNNNWGQDNVMFYQHFQVSWGYSFGQSWVNSSSASSGNWFNINDNYLGLRIKVGSDYYYGWARLTVGFTLKDYAFYDLPNYPILAGETDCENNFQGIVATPDTMACEGEIITLNIPPTISDSIKWSDGSSIFGIGSSMVEVSQSGNYFSIFSYPLCNDTTNQISIIFNPLPTTGIIYISDSLIADQIPNAHYQWFSYTNPIPNSDHYYFVPIQSSYYKVYVTNEFGCSKMSDYFHVIIPTGIENPFEQNDFQFSIENKLLLFHLADISLLGNQIEIINELGQLVATVTVSNQNPETDLSALPGGIYFFHIRSKQKTYSGKFFIE